MRGRGGAPAVLAALASVVLAGKPSAAFFGPPLQHCHQHQHHRRSTPPPAWGSRNEELMLQLLERKKYEVRQLEKIHKDMADPVNLRQGFISDTSSYTLTRALRLSRLGDTRKISVMGDLKRLSPTSKNLPRTVSGFVDAGRRARECLELGVNVLSVNTDQAGWGGKLDDLNSVVQARKDYAKNIDPSNHTAVVMKDLIIHPIQIAEALERGANGVILQAGLLGAQLGPLLDAATIMGTEAIVEVHTPNECDYALELGAMILMVNNWDRTDGKWHRNQAECVREVIPDNVVTIAAGGISSSEEATRLAAIGYDCVCLGRALAAHPDPDKLVANIRRFRGHPASPGTNGLLDAPGM